MYNCTACIGNKQTGHKKINSVKEHNVYLSVDQLILGSVRTTC